MHRTGVAPLLAFTLFLLLMEPAMGFWGRRRRRLTFQSCNAQERARITSAMVWLGDSTNQCFIDAQMGRNNLWDWGSDRRRTQRSEWGRKIAKRPRKFKCARRRRRNPSWIGKVYPPFGKIHLNLDGRPEQQYRATIAHEIGHLVRWHFHRSGQLLCTAPRLSQSLGYAVLQASFAPDTGHSCSRCVSHTPRRRGVRRRSCSALQSVDISHCSRRRRSGGSSRSRSSRSRSRRGPPDEILKQAGGKQMMIQSEAALRAACVDDGAKPQSYAEQLEEARELLQDYDLNRDGRLSEQEVMEDYDPPVGYEYPPKAAPSKNRTRLHMDLVHADSDGDGLDPQELLSFCRAVEANAHRRLSARDAPGPAHNSSGEGGGRALFAV